MTPESTVPDNPLYEMARVIEANATGQLDLAIVAQLRRTASYWSADPIFSHDEYVLALEIGAGWLTDHVSRGEKV